MRTLLATLILLSCPALVGAEDRFGIPSDLKTYPQTTPKETLASILKAVQAKQVAYLAAHLADPVYINERVKRFYGGQFEEQVSDIRGALNPLTVKQMQRFLDKGTWTTDKTTATVRLDDLPDRVVRLVSRDGRWFLTSSWSASVKP